MMRKFKHKVTGWLANQSTRNEYWYEVQHHLSDFHFIHAKLVENSQDREEVVEKDWVELCIEEIKKSAIRYTAEKGIKRQDTTYEQIKEAIEKHAPKQKKFTRNEIVEWKLKQGGLDHISYTDIISNFLKDHGLLSEDTQGEKSE